MILTLEKAHAGSLELETAQCRVKCPIDTIGLKPKTRDCGGLRKRIEIYRLPDQSRSRKFSFSFPLKKLRRVDNPVYIRVAQEDGHVAWTSPVYVV